MTTEHRNTWDPTGVPRNSSARKFFAAAFDGGWDTKAELVTAGAMMYVEITAVWPGEVPDGRWFKVVAKFDFGSGAFWEASIRLIRRGKEVSGPGRNIKISDLISGLTSGPKWYAQQVAEAEQKATEREAAEKVRRAALAEAAQIDAVVDLVGRTKRERNSAVSDLRNSLEAVIGRAKEAIDNLDQGFVPRSMGGVLGQNAAEAERLVGKVAELVEATARLEALFGPADKALVWDTWLDRRERLAAQAQDEVSA